MRKSQGFTLIELLIVIAIIAIIAAVAIPNLLQAHMRSNEANAAALLRKYADAQEKFKARTGAYADELRRLRGGSDDAAASEADKALNLIDRDFANAGGLSGAPNHGYLFSEPAGVGDAGFWENRFALLAVPTAVGRTGNMAFYIDENGVILMKELPAGSSPANSLQIDTPLKNAPGWVTK